LDLNKFKALESDFTYFWVLWGSYPFCRVAGEGASLYLVGSFTGNIG